MLRAPRSPLLRRVDLVETIARRSGSLLVWLGVPISVAAGVQVWADWTGGVGAFHLLAALLGAAVLQSLVVLLAFTALRCVALVADGVRTRSWDRALRSLE